MRWKLVFALSSVNSWPVGGGNIKLNGNDWSPSKQQPQNSAENIAGTKGKMAGKELDM